MSKHFTQLHLHTEFSLLDGAIKLEKLVEIAKQQNYKSLAITDHGNIFGAVKFFQLCKKAGIKPILGMETYFTTDIKEKNPDNKYNHIILLVKNEIGYQNLCKLISISYLEGFYFKPRIDYAALKKYSEGLIATTACLGGHIPSLLMQNKLDEAEKYLNLSLEIFGKENFFFELQPPHISEQAELNKKLLELSKKYSIKCIVTTDCHYLSLEDREAHEIMLSIQTGTQITDPKRFSFGDYLAYMQTEAELLELFKENPELLYNTGEIADRCNFDFNTKQLIFPEFKLESNITEANFFKELCYSGFEKLLKNKRFEEEKKESYLKRLNLEIDLIIKTGFVSYFLIVSDFTLYAKNNGIPVGPGRGSVVGSLVAWCLEITNLDPLKYNLLFERFINPERISMPDIDIDFCIEGREKVINYIKDKYGHENVCQIITFGTMMAKGVLKDVARVLGFSFEDSNMITALIPDQLKITLKQALENEPKLANLIETNPKVKKLFDIALKLEGITRHASKHAAGIVITPKKISDILPIYIPPKTNEIVSQYAMSELESLGFLKIDLLGLKNLTLIKNTLIAIEKNHSIKIDIDFIPLDDKKTFELLQSGKTSGIFQLESDGLKEVLRKLKPEKFEDIIAVNALYRPGPLGSGMVNDFIERKHGRQTIEYLFTELTPILSETYGVIVYQEQVMKIAATIGGYSLGEADILRRAMGKKKADVMAEQKKVFLEKSKKLNFESKKCEQLFDLMEYFSGYGFNKSHSAAYALIAFQTAYLKANYTTEFIAELISLETNNTEKMSAYLQDAKELGIKILQPDINKSDINFKAQKNKLLFGLQGIKNIGTAALYNIISNRTQFGDFTDILNLCIRIDLRIINKRILESLICAGALDSLPGTRSQKFTELHKIMERATEIKKEQKTGQMALFNKNLNKEIKENYSFEEKKEWENKEKLEKEKSVLDFYLSAHPLDEYENIIKSCKLKSFTEILENSKSYTTETIVISYGIIKNIKEIITKKGDKMAFVNIEDKFNEAECIIFPKIFKKIETHLKNYTIFIFNGFLDINSKEKLKIKINEFIPAESFLENWPNLNEIKIIAKKNITEKTINELKTTLENKYGNSILSFIFKENNKIIKYKTKKKYKINIEFLNKFKDFDFNINL